MSSTSSSKPQRSQTNRKNNGSSGELKTHLPALRISTRNRRRNSADSAIRNPGTHFLNPKIDPVKIYFRDDGSIFDNKKHDPSKLSETIVTLYKCLKRHKDFKDTKVWDHQPSVLELGEYLLAEARSLTPKYGQMSFGYDRSEKLRLLYYTELGHINESFVLPLEWIAEIKKESPSLYDLVMGIVSKVADRWDLDVIQNNYNDFIIEEVKSGMYEQHDEENPEKLLEDGKAYWGTGEANMFHKELKKYLRKFKMSDLSNRVNRSRAKGMLNEDIISWLKLGLKALQDPRNISDYYYNDPDAENRAGWDGHPINANDMFGFLWSFHDLIFASSESHIECTAETSGVCSPMIIDEYFPDSKPRMGFGKESIQQLCDFMELGREIYFKYYDEHFNKLHNDKDYQKKLIHILQ